MKRIHEQNSSPLDGEKPMREKLKALQAELLALNVAFESARAGEAGIGLAQEAEALRNIAGRIFAVREKTGAWSDEKARVQTSGHSKTLVNPEPPN